MPANRKKGKKTQNSNQGKSSQEKVPPATAVSVSDNAAASGADPVSVDWSTGDAASSEVSLNQESQVQAGSTEVSIPQNTAETESVKLEGVSPALETEADPVFAEETDTEVGAELKFDLESTGSESDTSASEPAEEAASEPATTSTDETTAGVGAGNAPSAVSPSDVAPEEISAKIAEWPSFGQNRETVAKDQSEVKLTTNSVEEAKSAPQKVSPSDAQAMDENFAKDEIRTLLVPVNPFHRLLACIIVIFSYSILGYIILKTPAGLNAQGMHTIDLPAAGSWVFFFRGDTQDAYGWGVDGRFRRSLEVDMEPVEPQQKVERIEQFKDLSGANFFSVAEFEVNQPGKYNLWIKWNDPNAKCKGKIQYEKDPVETFFFKWALGIVGTIAFFYMVGIPLTTRKAQTTLPNSLPPVVTK